MWQQSCLSDHWVVMFPTTSRRLSEHVFRRPAALLAALVFLLLGSGPAYTQATPPGPTPTTIEFTAAIDCYPVMHADSTVVASVEDLVAEYNDGSLWLQLQTDLKAILSTCNFSAPLSRLTPADFTSRTFLVTFVANDRQPYYVVVPQQQPYSMTLRGREVRECDHPR